MKLLSRFALLAGFCAADIEDTQQYKDYLKSSGIAGIETPLNNFADPQKSKYDSGSTLQAFTDQVTADGTYFSGVFSDHVVLQVSA